MSKLSTEERDKLPSSAFGLPSKRMFPLDSENRVRLAWDMVDRAEGLTEAEREEARRNILKRAKELGMDTSGWDKNLKAGMELTLYASTPNILFKDLSHPNRMPFSGILTYFDAPSDKPPGGASGNRVLIPKEVGEPALASLKGMAVNFVDGGWDGHDPQMKIGVITDAKLLDPLADGSVPVQIEGYIYAHDFSDAAASIKANQSILGFSYETANTRLEPGEYNGEPVLVVKELGYFTGASILLKDTAAYQKTSIAANADTKGGYKLEEFKELLASALADFKKDMQELVEEKFKALEAKAEQEEVKEEPKAEVKAEEEKVEEKQAELSASADLLAEIKALQEQIAELKASADKEVPQRKSVAYPTTLMAKYDIKPEDDYKKLMASISERKELSVEDRLALKFEARNNMNK